ncbi:MAG TPA: metalloregulator ArsR/SmtB family transcription factor [Rivihabitans pingtungensis]|nr:metalloregulator ArsR/SmtB family transcription factor [Rivihabitans pingtungensis]HNX69710.1 metalloregulator ArsR/SmtB family transcription factor [Rivihabitans pingtungensis]
MRPHARAAAQLLKALAHEERLMILCNLLEGERTAGELWQRSSLSQSAFSQHLAVLRGEGLIRSRKTAQTIHYALNPSVAMDVLRVLQSAFCPSQG